jgi:TRAP-type C4-dicarboxylate transport system substrate-binding protein
MRRCAKGPGREVLSFAAQLFHTEETAARKNTFWHMFEPLVISKPVYDSLTKEQQQAINEVGASLEKYAFDAAKADDVRVADVYAKTGAKVFDMDDATFAPELATWLPNHDHGQ